ncbi:Wzz/FepE/Etk N-terminal domain-containing protein [Flavobacterium cellulosilyticum]|uniref:Lipopolysaccharide biosynthesis protein n=1 Tax=Flavobacterium cellulosilyticum TaxID=2541731 RepID=A0A4R5CH54_9FLAO|nr:Wzz/FepE/Etk N-terminal domain-containing protein [Flavobacterium cellulosilyticum]TDD98376.1 lipopolysaccharide biosynthesis protein [Flavobacterium cellulosilyticum]
MISNEQASNDNITIKILIDKVIDWYRYFYSHKILIIIVVVIGALIGLGYSIINKPIYTATLTFVVEDEKSSGGIGSVLGLASSFGLDLGGGGGNVFSGANLNELFMSRSMVEKTFLSPVKVEGKIISLAEMFIQNAKWREAWNKKPKLAKIQFSPNANRSLFTRTQDSILGVMYKIITKNSLSVSQKDKKISIINIDMSSNNELFAKYFCEALADEVSEFYIMTKSKKARMNMAILERQTDSIRGELNHAITGVAAANDNVFNLNPSINIRRVPSARKQVDVQANTAILTELVKQTELAKVTIRRETPLIQIIDSPILPLEVEKLGKLKGLVSGGFLAGLLLAIILMFKKLFL